MLVHGACNFVYYLREDGLKASCKLLLQHVHVVFVQMDGRFANMLRMGGLGKTLRPWRA